MASQEHVAVITRAASQIPLVDWASTEASRWRQQARLCSSLRHVGVNASLMSTCVPQVVREQANIAQVGPVDERPVHGETGAPRS